MTRRQDEPTATIARRVRELRGKMTAEQLADRMRELGVPFDKNVVANLETGRRRFVTVQELLALAYVLNVSPGALLVSPDADASQPYEVTPEMSASTAAVRQMLDGRWPLPGMDPWVYFREMPAGERMPEDKLANAIWAHQQGMRPITPGDVPGGADGER